jgi:chromosome partitioning protein
MSIWTTFPAKVAQSPTVPVLTVGNLKGGVGKTSVVANLATALVQKGLRVLAIDIDFQASLSVALPPQIMPRHETSDGGINVLLGSSYDMFHDSRVTSRGVGNFSDLSLVRTSLELAKVEDMLFASFILGKEEQDPRFALCRKLLDPRLENDFDIVIIDTPPRLTIGTINAICASSHVLIPTALTPVARSGAATFVQYIREFYHAICPRLHLLGILPTLTSGTLTQRELAILNNMAQSISGVPIWTEQHIPRREAIANNLVHQHAPSRARFEALAEKIMTELNLKPGGTDEGLRAHGRTQFGWHSISH